MGHYIDIFLLGLGAYFVIRGLFKGLSGEVVSLFAVIGGFWGALKFHGPVGEIISRVTGLAPMPSSAAAMALIFIAVNLVCLAMRIALKKAIDGTSLTWLDKALGAAAGLLKIYLVSLAVLMAAMVSAPLVGDQWVQDSRMLVTTAKSWQYVQPVLDGMGLLPDLSKAQDSARGFMLRAAGQTLMEAGADKSRESEEAPSESAPLAAPEAVSEDAKSSSLFDWVADFFSPSR